MPAPFALPPAVPAPPVSLKAPASAPPPWPPVAVLPLKVLNRLVMVPFSLQPPPLKLLPVTPFAPSTPRPLPAPPSPLLAPLTLLPENVQSKLTTVPPPVLKIAPPPPPPPLPPLPPLWPLPLTAPAAPLPPLPPLAVLPEKTQFVSSTVPPLLKIA